MRIADGEGQTSWTCALVTRWTEPRSDITQNLDRHSGGLERLAMLLTLVSVPAPLLGTRQIILDRESVERFGRLPRSAFGKPQFACAAITSCGRDESHGGSADAFASVVLAPISDDCQCLPVD
jgi:hypothetical protein